MWARAELPFQTESFNEMEGKDIFYPEQQKGKWGYFSQIKRVREKQMFWADICM